MGSEKKDEDRQKDTQTIYQGRKCSTEIERKKNILTQRETGDKRTQRTFDEDYEGKSSRNQLNKTSHTKKYTENKTEKKTGET